MTRREFIESVGGTCSNWQWSWSFVNHAQHFVIFGAWDRNTKGHRSMILSEDWKTNNRGRRYPGYQQSREHVRLVEEDGYQLKTFPMQYSDARKDESGIGPATIGGFTPELSDRSLAKIGNAWYAADDSGDIHLAEELDSPERYSEGAKTTVTVNAIERSAEARRACTQHHGLDCAVCGWNFQAAYGPLGEGFIHVHHVKPLSEIGEEYEVDPFADLRPVCPNCHSIIHLGGVCRSIEEVRQLLAQSATLNRALQQAGGT